ncbi:MAG: Dna2/Cas4 domain-containing protein [Candidatus Thermoplasmatota archaeon]|jgi:CRISPR-associated exonuclease Cas4|nr:Dna2/Cas4 domain-containing protein [Candidatus Thermoplasmatota archaeon]
MTSGDLDRLISASEVERWSYCPLSWKLSRDGDGPPSLALSSGIEQHNDIGKRAEYIKRKQTGAKDLSAITWSYIVFSSFLVFMGGSLLLLVRVGFMQTDIWRLVVLLVSVILIGASITFYFFRKVAGKREGRERVRSLVVDFEDRRKRPRSIPVLLYLYGILLLVNGIILLRPLGLEPRDASVVLTISLLVLYILLLFTAVTSFWSRRPIMMWVRSRLVVVMVLMLLLSLSALFMFLYESFDREGVFPYILLGLSLLWFILAVFYDLWLKRRLQGEQGPLLGGREDLPVATLALLASLFTGSLFVLGAEDIEHYTLFSALIAVFWIGGAAYFFFKASSERKGAMEEMGKLELPPKADIVSVDRLDGKRGKVLTSRRHFLAGTPDLIIEEEGLKIPVEVKTGKVPPKPHFSHMMQLGAYLILTDVNYDQRTPYGYIDYIPSGGKRSREKVEWDMMTKALVLSKVSEIREAERLGEVHRNHNREGKCLNCSRRSTCPERLV